MAFASLGAVLGYQYSLTGPVTVADTTPPTADAATACAALHADLPATLDGRAHRTTVPASPDTAAWGSPAVTLRCGVAKPGIITPGADDYNPLNADLLWLKGVTWVVEERSNGYLFTTAYRKVQVEAFVPEATLNVPQTGLQATDAIGDLAAPVLAAIPRQDGTAGPDADNSLNAQ